MEKKFIKLIESLNTRLTRGGFLVGDYVEFFKNYKSHPEYKALNDMIKKSIDELANSKLNIRVTGINDTHALRYPGNPDQMNGHVTLSLSEDQGGGRIYGNTLVPSCLCKVLDHYPNYPKFPDEWNYDNKEILKPIEVKTVESGNGVVYNLPKEDTKIKPSSSKSKKKVNKESYTAEYVLDMK